MANRRKYRKNDVMENGISNLQNSKESLLSSEQISEEGDAEPSRETAKMELTSGDKSAITLLMFLYVLQGIPLGLAGCLPYLLQDRKVSYTDQAVLSFIFWPYSVKLLWAPLVDCIFVARFGRRKSWLVPTQYLIGLFMIVLSSQINSLMGYGDSGPVNIRVLAVVFFALNFLAATQDIAVDGWALTMLSRANVGWASTCNAVGQTAGYFLGNVVFLTLQSADFCNSYLRSTPSDTGLVTFQGYLFFWGVVYIGLTTMVMVFKKEKANFSIDIDGDTERGIVAAYQLLWHIVRLPAVLQLIAVLLTAKVGYAAADAVTGLKLIEEGMPKETLTLLGVLMVPLETTLPIFISRYTVGSTPMNVYLRAVPFRLLLGLAFTLVVYWAPYAKSEAGGYSMYFYISLLVGLTLHQIAATCMFVATMSLFAKVSDPGVGGTYMTLLNTVTNFAGSWPNTLVLSSMDYITSRTCHLPDDTLADCSSKQALQECQSKQGSCQTSVDGYYIASVMCCALGFVWLVVMAPRLRRLQLLSPGAWAVTRSRVSA